MTAKRPSAGFTLLEALLAVLLLGLVLLLLDQGVQGGVRAVATLARGRPPQFDLSPVEQSLRRMIERMDPGRFPEPPQIRGGPEALAFTTELPDAATGALAIADIRLQAEAGALVLWWTPHGQGIPLGAPPAPRRLVLLERVARLELAYAPRAASAAWQTVWAEPRLPALIRLRLVPPEGTRAWPPIIVRPLREPAEE
jgi:hypothetical protein